MANWQVRTGLKLRGGLGHSVDRVVFRGLGSLRTPDEGHLYSSPAVEEAGELFSDKASYVLACLGEGGVSDITDS